MSRDKHLLAISAVLIMLASHRLALLLVEVQGYRMLEHGICKSFDGNKTQPIDPTSTFRTTDEQATVWFSIEIAPYDIILVLNAKWYRPDGVLQKSDEWDRKVRTGKCWFWTSLPISGKEASRYIGVWKVEVYEGITFLFREEFTIGMYFIKVFVSGLPNDLSADLLINSKNSGQIWGATPASFSVEFGRRYTIEVKQSVSGKQNVRYVCKNNVLSVESDQEARTCTFVYITQYYLTVSSAKGQPQGQGWYDAGSVASFSVGPTVVLGFPMYIFERWDGDSTSTSSSATVAMNSPKTVVALWRADYTATYVIIAAVIGASACAVALTARSRKKNGRPPAPLGVTYPEAVQPATQPAAVPTKTVPEGPSVVKDIKEVKEIPTPKIISIADASSALDEQVYKYIVAHEGEISRSEATKELSISLDELNASIDRLRKKGRLQ